MHLETFWKYAKLRILLLIILALLIHVMAVYPIKLTVVENGGLSISFGEVLNELQFGFMTSVSPLPSLYNTSHLIWCKGISLSATVYDEPLSVLANFNTLNTTNNKINDIILFLFPHIYCCSICLFYVIFFFTYLFVILFKYTVNC